MRRQRAGERAISNSAIADTTAVRVDRIERFGGVAIAVMPDVMESGPGNVSVMIDIVQDYLRQ